MMYHSKIDCVLKQELIHLNAKKKKNKDKIKIRIHAVVVFGSVLDVISLGFLIFVYRHFVF